MEIKNISTELPEKIDINSLIANTVKVNSKNEIENKQKVSQAPENWKNDILLEALDSLENNIQMDNTHPLSMTTNAPIETFEEALRELEYIKTEKFLNEASDAQANIKIDDVISLFTVQ